VSEQPGHHAHHKFDVTRLERLNDVGRFDTMRPDVMWAVLGEPTPLVIVDIGAGTGLFTRWFADAAPEATVYAVDTESVMLDWLGAHLDDDMRDRVHPVRSEESAVPLESSSADLVLMLALHHELADPLASYREALRVLHPGGQLLVVDWRPGDTESGPPQHVRASAERIGEWLTSAGFTEVTAHEGLPEHSLITARKPRA
jgi:ubiquinone/menaquinone biosynthesis C-methylase UbiE